MKGNFNRAFDFVLGIEGNLHWEPKGGWTNFGFCEKAWPEMDIKGLTLDGARALAKTAYWDKCGCDSLKYPLDIYVFDTAFNCGVSVANKLKKRTHNPTDYLMERINYYAVEIPGDALDGWFVRVYKIYKEFGTGDLIEKWESVGGKERDSFINYLLSRYKILLKWVLDKRCVNDNLNMLK